MKTSTEALQEYYDAYNDVHEYLKEVKQADQTYWELHDIASEKLTEYFEASAREGEKDAKYFRMGCIFLIAVSLATAFFIICGIIMLTR